MPPQGGMMDQLLPFLRHRLYTQEFLDAQESQDGDPDIHRKVGEDIKSRSSILFEQADLLRYIAWHATVKDDTN